MDKIRLFKVGMHEEAAVDLVPVLNSGYIGQGPEVEMFERELQHYLGLEQRPVTLNSCTSAIDLALHLIGVGPGDEVITTPLTCTATNSHIVHRGATIVWADVDLNGLIEPYDIAQKITKKTKAIIAVDWAGRTANYDLIKKFAGPIPVIQDAAHTFGPLPAYGDYTAWSFQAIKFLTTGDGGALLVPPEQDDRARLLRWYGLDRTSSADFRCSQDIFEVGYKYHMNDIAARIGRTNLKWAVGHMLTQRRNAHQILEGIRRRHLWDEYGHYWFLDLIVRDNIRFQQWMAEHNIETSKVHARNDKHPGFREAAKVPHEELPGVDFYDDYHIAIPCGWWLNQYEILHIIAAVKGFYAQPSEIQEVPGGTVTVPGSAGGSV